jgi:hypothetical protein
MTTMMGKAFAMAHNGRPENSKRSSSTDRRRPPSINTHFDASDAHPRPHHPVSPHGLVSPPRQSSSSKQQVVSPRHQQPVTSPRSPSPRRNMPPSPRSSSRRAGQNASSFHFDSPRASSSGVAVSPRDAHQPTSPKTRSSPRRRSNSSSERDMMVHHNTTNNPTSSSAKSPRQKTPQHYDGKSPRARTPSRGLSESRNDTTTREGHVPTRDSHNKEPDHHKQVKVVYSEFGDDARRIISRKISSSIPKISAPTDLIIQVEVRHIPLLILHDLKFGQQCIISWDCSNTFCCLLCFHCGCSLGHVYVCIFGA